MPSFTFTSPEGKTYTVNGPDGATKEQAFGILQQQLSSAKPEAPKTGLEALPPEPGANTRQPQPPEESLGKKIAGVGEASLAMGSSIPAGIAGQAYGAGKALLGGKYGTQAGVEQGEKAGTDLADKLTYKPRTQTGQQITEAAGKALEPLQALPVEGGMLSRIPDVPKGLVAAGEGVTDLNARAARGAMMAPKALTKAAIGKLPDLDPETKQLAQDAHSMGFRLSPHQVYGSKYGKALGELAEENPLIKNNKETNQKVFNQQLVKQIGGEGDKLTRKTFADSMKKSGETIGGMAEKTQVPLTPKFLGGLRDSALETSKYQTADVSRAVNNYLDEIVDKSVDGVLPGKALRTISSKIGTQMRSTQNGDLKFALGDIQDNLHDAMMAGLGKEDQAALATARKRYAIGKTLEPMVAKSPTGDIPPALLLGAITSSKAGKSMVARNAAGDLGKLADIGQKFLKSQPSSGTAERSAMQNILAHPIGSLAAAGTAAVTSPLAAAYNRVGPRVTQKLIDRPPKP